MNLSTCIKDFYDSDLNKNCTKCAIISLKPNYHKDKSRKDGLHPRGKSCRKKILWWKTRQNWRGFFRKSRKNERMLSKKFEIKFQSEIMKIWKTDLNQQLISLILQHKTKDSSCIERIIKIILNGWYFGYRYWYSSKMDWVSLYNSFDLKKSRDRSRKTNLISRCVQKW